MRQTIAIVAAMPEERDALRALSDVPAHGDDPPDFHAFLRRAAARSADICLELVKKLERIERL